jgi:hypothetical protein
MISRLSTLAALCAFGLVAAAPASAQHDGRGGPGGGGRESHFDARYHHDHSYPARGLAFHEPPRDAVLVNHHGGRYWFGGGAWYGAYGPRWVVVAPPIGIFVPILPPFYTTVWFGGIPYYYANDAYYMWRDSEHSYEVVDPPGNVAASTEAPPSEDIYTYPRSGQSAELQARDRYECHRWAADQTGFDPTRPAGGVAAADSTARRGEYFRAMTACLEGRGYSVK